jgi:UDP-N-acetylglucosamine--N-acetylmuramyl-(pentapeptide) pyrophosphoryl-undecaprenol N-acetylglucosamine transferase
MPRRYRQAQLVVCRAGAISVAELALAGRAALLIPLAHVGGGEQFANARQLSERDAAQVLDSRQLGHEEFSAALQALLADPERLASMGRRAAGLACPQAAEDVVAACEALRERRHASAGAPPEGGGQ